MGKIKRARKKKTPVAKVSEGIGSAYNEGFTKLVDTSSRDYIYDEIDQYHEDVEKADLLKAHRGMQTKRAKKENLLSLNMGSSDDEMDEDEPSASSSDDEEPIESQHFSAADDIVEAVEQKLPDARAWGKDRNLYYGTNVTDQNLKKRAHQMHKKEVYDVATLEMEAHAERRKRLEQQLQGFDPMDILNMAPLEQKDGSTSTKMPFIIQSSSGENLSKQEKLKLLEKLSPEFRLLKDDMIAKCKECETMWAPLMKAHADGLLAACPGFEYITLKYRLCSNYPLSVMNYVYVILQEGHNAVKNHPVMDRLARYRFLFKELTLLDELMKDQVTTLLNRLKNNEPLNLLHPPEEEQRETRPTHLLGVVQRTTKDEAADVSKTEIRADEESSDSDDEANKALSAAGDSQLVDEDDKRLVGKAILSNRGLTPHRRKDLKNPRVKYKTKYLEKVKRRKGQVRPVRNEIPFYSGEKTGINAYAVKSIKLK